MNMLMENGGLKMTPQDKKDNLCIFQPTDKNRAYLDLCKKRKYILKKVINDALKRHFKWMKRNRLFEPPKQKGNKNEKT